MFELLLNANMTAEKDWAAWVLFSTTVLTLFVVWNNARASVRNKQADTVAAFNKQFDVLQKERSDLTASKPDTDKAAAARRGLQVKILMDRFWSLQFEQFLAWRSGFVPTDLYIYWAFSRWRGFKDVSSSWGVPGFYSSVAFCSICLEWEGKSSDGLDLPTPCKHFLRYMQELRESPTAAGLQQLLWTHAPNRVLVFIRKLFGHY